MARSFNGTTDRITIGDVIDLAGSTTFTIHCWIYPTTSRAQRLVSKWGSSGLQYLMQMTSAGSIELVAHDASGHQPLRDGVAHISANVWTACTVRMNGIRALDMAIFINGVGDSGSSSGSNLSGGIQNTTQQLCIGDDAGAGATLPFAGRIAEVAIWDVALGDFEIAALGSGILPPHFHPENLQAYWPLYGVDSPEIAVAGTARTAGTLTGTSFGAGPPVNPELVGLFV